MKGFAADDGDVQLMLELQQGRDDALNRLIERWEQPLHSFVYRYAQNHADASDLVQETFVRVYRYRGRYRPRSRFSTWLFAIAANLCRNRARWLRRHPTVSLEEPVDDNGKSSLPRADHLEDVSADLPADVAEASDKAEAVKAAILELPHDLKTAILLFQYDNMTYQEIGEVIGCSPKAVENRLYRARGRLRKKLAWLLRDERGDSLPRPSSMRSAIDEAEKDRS